MMKNSVMPCFKTPETVKARGLFIISTWTASKPFNCSAFMMSPCKHIHQTLLVRKTREQRIFNKILQVEQKGECSKQIQ